MCSNCNNLVTFYDFEKFNLLMMVMLGKALCWFVSSEHSKDDYKCRLFKSKQVIVI